MINKLGLKNFKAFADLPKIDIKPITVFCGANSSGKSSILKSILLLKQTMESQNPKQTLLLNGRLTHLGTFESNIYRNEVNNTVEFSLEIDVKKEDLKNWMSFNQIPVAFLLNRLPKGKEWQWYHIEYKVSLRMLPESVNKGLKPIVVEKTSIIVKPIEKDLSHDDLFIEIIHQGNSDYEFKCTNVAMQEIDKVTRIPKVTKIPSISFKAKAKFINLVPYLLASAQGDEQTNGVERILHAVFGVLEAALASYTYLGPLREEPARRYIYENEVVDVGIKGENAPYVYWAEGDSVIKEHFFYNDGNDQFEKTDSIKLIDALHKWLNLMGIKKLSTSQETEIMKLVLQSNAASEVMVNIADVGFGVSQIFPVILEGLRMKKMCTLILEQPEIHLHPNLQMQMADYFISLVLSGKKVIVETHSEHIINRLIRRVVEDEKYNLNDMLAIYFSKSGDDGSSVELIEIDRNKGIRNWPKDFFDQAAFEQEKIMLAGLKKRASKGQ